MSAIATRLAGGSRVGMRIEWGVHTRDINTTESAPRAPMVSTSFLLDVVVYGLIAAVVVPVIDLILFSMRSSGEPGRASFDFGFDEGRGRRADAELPTGRSGGNRGTATGKEAAPSSSFAGDHEERKPSGAPRSPELVIKAAGLRKQSGIKMRLPISASAASTRIAEAHGETRTDAGLQRTLSDARTKVPVGYVSSNGIVVTPNMSIFNEVTAAAGRIAPAQTAGAPFQEAGAPAQTPGAGTQSATPTAAAATPMIAPATPTAAPVAASAQASPATCMPHHLAASASTATASTATATTSAPHHVAAIVHASPASTQAPAAPAGHPHSEYWRYGSAHFYDSI